MPVHMGLRICRRHGWNLSFEKVSDGFVTRVDFDAQSP